MSVHGHPWDTLGIAPTRDQTEIRRAYAKRLKQTNPEDDAEGFQALRQSYEVALRLATYDAGAFEPETEEDQPDYPAELMAPDVLEQRPFELARADDPAAVALDVALAALEQALTRDPVPADADLQALLAAVFACDLERFDLLQRAEGTLLDLLVQNTPRSDPLLAPTNLRFEWSHRKDDRALPQQAHMILERQAELALLWDLREGSGDDAKAYARLRAPPNPRRRFVDAYLLLLTSTWGEVDLIRRLREQHPRLLEGLNRDNVAWWDRFISRPRFSMLTFLAGFVPGLVAVLIFRPPPDPAAGAPPGFSGSLMLLWVAFALGFALFRLYAVDWPLLLAERAWPYDKPRWFAQGWMPATLALLVAGALAAQLPWVPAVIAVLAALVAWWSTIATGPVPPLFAGFNSQLSLENSRVLRAGRANLLSGIWFALAASELHLPWPFIVTVLAAMWASGIDQRVLIEAFVTYLGPRQRTWYSVFLIALAGLLTVPLVKFGNDDTWQVPLLIAVMCLVLLRRPLVFAVRMPAMGIRAIIFGFIIAFNLLRVLSDSHTSVLPAGGPDGGTLIVGGILMLAGVVVVAISSITPNRR